MMTNIQISTSKKTSISNTAMEHDSSTRENSNSINMSITVKAYLQTADDSQEIRRFAVDQGASTSYEYLSTKITQVFPSIGRSDSFTLSYRDSEDGLVAFSNDTELADVLGQLNEGILKVYIHLTGKKCRNNASKCRKKVYQPRITCNGCESRIAGPRFKCVVCPGYDLCKVCEEKGLHPEHEMIKMRKPQIGRSHMEGFTSRPGLWQFVSGGLRPKMKWNRVCRERRQEHTEMRSEYDSEATEVASGNTNEGTNPQQKHIKHTVHMSGTLTIPKQKRLVQRKVISKTSNNDGMEYRESKASKNNHQRHRLNQRAGKHFILQKPFGCCKDCIPEMNILSTQLKRFQQERKMKQHRATPFKSHKCNDPNILLITTPSLFKRINHLEKEGMIKRNCSTLTKPVKEHGCIGPKTCVSAGKRYRRFHQAQRKMYKARCNPMAKQLGGHRCSRNSITLKSGRFSDGKKFKRCSQSQSVKGQQKQHPGRIVAHMAAATFNAQKRHLSTNSSPGMENSKGFDVDVHRRGMRKHCGKGQKGNGPGNQWGKGPRGYRGSAGLGGQVGRCQPTKGHIQDQAVASKH